MTQQTISEMQSKCSNFNLQQFIAQYPTEMLSGWFVGGLGFMAYQPI